jgi:hypothetical protein
MIVIFMVLAAVCVCNGPLHQSREVVCGSVSDGIV